MIIQKIDTIKSVIIKVNLYQHEFDFLVSLLYNTGTKFLNVGGANGGENKLII